MKSIAIIPALNEHQRLQAVAREALKYVDQVVIVDDGSSQPLGAVMEQNPRLRVLRHVINLGKGAAMKTGVQWALTHGFEVAVFVDADGQHNPAEIPRLLAPIESGEKRIVFGVRQFHHTMPLVARAGNIFLSKSLGFLFGIKVRDTQSGFRAMALRSYDALCWRSPRYAVETEMIVNAGKHHVPYAQVSIETIYYDKYKGTTIIDGIRIMINMITWRFL